MSNVQEFEELLRSDEDLQEKMRVATEAFEGDMADELAVFEAVVVPLAAEVGLPFTYEEAAEYARTVQELSLDDLDEAAGGGLTIDFCFIIGSGKTKGCTGGAMAGGKACSGPGVGMVITFK